MPEEKVPCGIRAAPCSSAIHPSIGRLSGRWETASRDLAALAVGHGAELPKRLRAIVRVLSGEDEASAGMLSYLPFERPFTSQLMELGYEDTVARWPVIERFFAGVAAGR